LRGNDERDAGSISASAISIELRLDSDRVAMMVAETTTASSRKIAPATAWLVT
jgi:hypothetical protein